MTWFLVDMDGTIVDTHAVVKDSWGRFADRHGLDRAEVLDWSHGRPAVQTARHFLGDDDLAVAETARMAEYEVTVDDGVVPIPGSPEFLAAIPERRWALVTSAVGFLAARRLEQIGVPRPDVMVCSEDITSGKPEPEPYLLAARQLGADPADCIVLEDSDSGVRSGLAAGCRVVVVGELTTFDGQLPRITDFVGLTPADVDELTATAQPNCRALAESMPDGLPPRRNTGRR